MEGERREKPVAPATANEIREAIELAYYTVALKLVT